MHITVSRLIEDKGRQFDLHLVAGEKGMDSQISEPDLNRPGLAFAGFLDVYSPHRIQILGNTEIAYLESLSPEDRQSRLDKALSFEIPCIFITSGHPPPPDIIEIANKQDIPVFTTGHPTTRFANLLTTFLEREFAPTAVVHGVLMDIFGIGVLIMGTAGVGKSECGLELIERGHRLVADDVVMAKRLAKGLIVGNAASNVQHHMEVRGLGIVDVELLFGAGSVREEKRIDLIVKLERWTKETRIDRLGLDEQFEDVLGGRRRNFTNPVEPGRNTSILVEVAALQFRIHSQGRNPARELNERLIKQMARQRLV